MKRQELIECFGILLLALVLAVSLITMTRTCETLDRFSNVVSMNCIEVSSYEK